MKNTKEPLIVIVGPTAVGKTEISIQLAKEFQGEIISADSRLFYRGMDIGTAKPSRTEMESVPHHLINVADPDKEWSLAKYLKESQVIIEGIRSRGNLPFLVGGTGQYIKALVEGWELPAVQPDPRLREALIRWAEDLGPDQVRTRLNVLDPEAAEGIDGPNTRRMIRALEVILSTGRKFSAQKGKKGAEYRIMMVGLIRPREELYERIDQRVEDMLDAGLVDEVRSLLEQGYDPDSSAMSAIGYKQIAQYLLGSIPLEEAVRQIKSKTHKYVRQQANWFNENDPQIHWFSVSGDTFKEISGEIQQFLS